MAASRLNMLVDVVDSRDRVLGAIRRRALSSATANFRVAHVLVFNTRGELLTQRVATGLRSAGSWGSSVAAYVKSGESYREAASRKFEAELGVRSPRLRLVGKTKMPDLGGTKFITVYQALHDGPFDPNPSDVSALQFASLDEIDREREKLERQFTPTFLHVLEFFRSSGAAPRHR